MNSYDRENVSPIIDDSNFGLIQILLGIGTVIAATLASWFTVLALALILAFRGGLDLYKGYHPQKGGPKRLKGKIITGFASLSIGILLLIFPQIGAAFFSLALAILFIVGGLQKLVFPYLENIPTDKFTITTALVSLLLGVILIALWPVERFDILGVLVGIEILLNGMTVTLTGRAIGRMRRKEA
ncbi:MAG: HdeD family acid-resistance protein [Chitinispirillaceae bacterium]